MITTFTKLGFKTWVCGCLTVRNNVIIRRHVSLSRTVVPHENVRISVIEKSVSIDLSFMSA